jgi:hypothetical protein
MRYWINTISREHVQRGLAGGFTQADHGKNSRLKRLSKGDQIIFYSPRTEFGGGEPLQSFTAAGEIVDDTPYQVEVSADFHPWRRRVKFFACREAPIKPLIDELAFIPNKSSWGFPFRRGLFEIGESDFTLILESMNAEGMVE